MTTSFDQSRGRDRQARTLAQGRKLCRASPAPELPGEWQSSAVTTSQPNSSCLLLPGQARPPQAPPRALSGDLHLKACILGPQPRAMLNTEVQNQTQHVCVVTLNMIMNACSDEWGDGGPLIQVFSYILEKYKITFLPHYTKTNSRAIKNVTIKNIIITTKKNEDVLHIQ